MSTGWSVTDPNEACLAGDWVWVGCIGELFDHGFSIRRYGLARAGDDLALFLKDELNRRLVEYPRGHGVVVGIVTRHLLVAAIALNSNRRGTTQTAIQALVDQVFLGGAGELEGIHLHHPGSVEASLGEKWRGCQEQEYGKTVGHGASRRGRLYPDKSWMHDAALGTGWDKRMRPSPRWFVIVRPPSQLHCLHLSKVLRCRASRRGGSFHRSG